MATVVEFIHVDLNSSKEANSFKMDDRSQIWTLKELLDGTLVTV